MADNQIIYCPVCKSLSVNPVECISCSQIYCYACKPQLCLICKQGSIFNESKVAKKIISSIEVNCKFCDAKVKMGDLEDIHYKICPNYSINCGVDGCYYKGNKKDFVMHIIELHKELVLEEFTNDQEKENDQLPCIISKYPNETHDNYFKSMSYVDSSPKLDKSNVIWLNNSKTFVKTTKDKFLMSSKDPFSNLDVTVRFSGCTDYSYVMVGVSAVKHNGTKLYLGGETGKGDIGLAGNGSLGIEGKWDISCKSFLRFTIEPINIQFKNGEVSFRILKSGAEEKKYIYNLNVKQVYLTACLYNPKDTVTII